MAKLVLASNSLYFSGFLHMIVSDLIFCAFWWNCI